MSLGEKKSSYMSLGKKIQKYVIGEKKIQLYFIGKKKMTFPPLRYVLQKDNTNSLQIAMITDIRS